MSLLTILKDEAFSGLDDDALGKLKAILTDADDKANQIAIERDKLAANNAKLLDEKVKAIEKLTAAEQAALEAAEKIKNPENAGGIDPEQHKSELAKLKESFEKEIEAQQTRTKELQQQLATTAQEREIAKLVSEYNLNPEDAPFILDHYLRPVIVDGAVSVGVFENGEPALVAGSPKTPKQLLDGFLESGKHKTLFLAGNGGGMGASNNQQPGQGSAKTMKRSAFEGLSPVEQATFIKEGGKPID